MQEQETEFCLYEIKNKTHFQVSLGLFEKDEMSKMNKNKSFSN